MLLTPEEFLREYEQLREFIRSSESKILICVAPDCDSICTLQILERVFDDDFLLHTVVPVSSYADLTEAQSTYITDNEEYRTVFLLNCGVNADVTRFMGTGATVFVFDSHRPVHLHNADETVTTVGVIVTSEEEKEEIREATHIVSFPEESDEEDDEGGPARKKRRINRAQEEYYRMSYYGRPSAYLAYKLCSNLNRVRSDVMWNSIVSLTEYFILERIHLEEYDEMYSEFSTEVRRLFPVGDGNTGQFDTFESEDGVRVPFVKKGRIQLSKEYKFMLLKHWSLRESMFHTTHVAAVLGIWTEPGRRRLDTLLAKTGLPIEQAKQKFNCMSRTSKMVLDERIAEFSADMDLDDIIYDGFQLSVDFEKVFSAADVAFGISALIEQPIDEENDIAVNFWNGYNALRGDYDLIYKGFDLAKLQQQAVVHQGSVMLQNDSVHSCGTFRYAKISSSPYIEHFLQPSALSKLSLFLLEVRRHSKGHSKPLVLAALCEARGTYVVVGTTDLTVQRNEFGSAFGYAADIARARVKHDGFESSWIELHKDDFTKFLDTLHVNLAPPED